MNNKGVSFGKALSSCFVRAPWFGPLAFPPRIYSSWRACFTILLRRNFWLLVGFIIPALPSQSFFACSTATAIMIELTRGLSEENLFTRDCGMGEERRLLNFCYPVPMPGSIRKSIRLWSRP